MIRVAVYARYSTDMQSEASIEDQVELCRRHALAQGWTVVAVHHDRAMSGASAFRPGLQELLNGADQRQFDVVLVEALDRIGRKLADLAGIHDRLSFNQVKLHAISSGEMSAMHIGMLGTMAQMQLADLRDKTRRGLLGRVRAGKVPGGRAYGYDVVEPQAGARKGSRGDRCINHAEAQVVLRVFRDFAAGQSPRAIAKALNGEKVPPPDGRHWNDTTIRGQRDRGTGLLNNPLYVGRLEWNRTSYVKDPRTGRRVARVNPPAQREVVALPHLRIVDDELWQRVKDRQNELTRAANQTAEGNRLNRLHRPKFLLSGLLVCGQCGGKMTIVGKDTYGCRRHRASGTCHSKLLLQRRSIENRVLEAVRIQLMTPAMIAEFVAEYRREWGRLHSEARQSGLKRERDLATLDRKIAGIVRAIEDGAWTPELKMRLEVLETERAQLRRDFANRTHDAGPRPHPHLAGLYREKLERLEEALNDPRIRDEAAQILRGMIEKIVVHPDTSAPGGASLEVTGELGAILAAATSVGRKRQDPANAGSIGGYGLSVVAGTRNHLYRTLVFLPVCRRHRT